MSSQIEIDLGGLLPIAEKSKLLNHFIIKVEKSQVNNILKDCKGLPSTQYNLLKFLLANKFRRFDLIIELLYDGDSSIIRGATSKQWLYEAEDSSFTDSEFLINKLFPNVSYHCRQKVLNRIGRYLQNEEKADKIWRAVEEKYGFHVSFSLLQACSKDKINSVIANRKFDLSGYQLVQILQKYPDIGLQYLKDHDHFTNIGSSSTNSYRSPLAYLYNNHPDDFLDLCINHSDKINSFKFGNSRSKKIIRAYREKLLEKPTESSSFLKIARIRREFSTDEFQTFFESSFDTGAPANVNNENMWKWVNSVPIDKRVDMVNRAYMKLFQVNLNERYEYMNSTEYIVLLPDEKRLSVVQWKTHQKDQNYGWSFKDIYVSFYKDEEKKRAWLPLKPTSHSVPELEKLLLIEPDVTGRATLSKYLINTCYINEDLPQLLNVLLLLNKRCRNDQIEVRIGIFQTLCVIIDRMEFSKDHWDIIIEMIQVSLIMVDNRDYTDSEKEKLVDKCIAFHLASNLPSNNLVSMLIKLKIKATSTTWSNSYIKNEADRRSLLELYAKEMENLQLANDLRSHDGIVMESEKLSELIANLIEEICKFNIGTAKAASPKLEPISIASHQWLRTSLEKIAKEEEERVNKNSKLNNSPCSWNFAKQLVNIIRALRQKRFNETDSLFSKILLTSPCSSILTYFLDTNPSHLVENWSTTLSKMLKSESDLKFIKTLKLWNYSTLTVQAVKTCTDIIGQTFGHDSKVTILQKCNAVAVLSVLSEPSEFLLLAEKFYPTEKKVDVFSDNSKEEYQIRQAIAKYLLNVTVSHLTFPAIEKFCVGDYLKLAVAALNSHSGRASETKTLNFLRLKLVNSPVSLQKHIIRLYFAISSVKEKIHAFNEIDSSNVSIRYEIFLRASKLFRSSPSQETWTILKNGIEKATTEDASIIKYLHSTPKLDTCPTEYISDYIITCLTLLRKIKAEKSEDDFMNHVEYIMDKIPEKTLDDIILPNNVEQMSLKSAFCVKYLQHSSSESAAEHRLSNMWLLMQNVVRNGWDVKVPRSYDPNYFDYPARTSIHGFVVSLCQHEMDDASKAWLKGKIFQTLLEKFKTESVTKFFKEILYLEFGVLLVKEVEKTGLERLRAFGQSLARLTDSLVKTYGDGIILIIKDPVIYYVQACFLEEFFKNVGGIVELIDGILDTSKTQANQIIALSFLRNANPKSSNLMATLDKINNVLKASNDVVAQTYFGSITR